VTPNFVKKCPLIPCRYLQGVCRFWPSWTRGTWIWWHSWRLSMLLKRYWN